MGEVGSCPHAPTAVGAPQACQQALHGPVGSGLGRRHSRGPPGQEHGDKPTGTLFLWTCQEREGRRLPPAPLSREP